ncbi:hypothetical protein KEM52_005930 [Ascosphaera acerosa]|nr:hypothetical protein KEM52_005930 [Ascosphaera acerosa]
MGKKAQLDYDYQKRLQLALAQARLARDVQEAARRDATVFQGRGLAAGVTRLLMQSSTGDAMAADGDASVSYTFKKPSLTGRTKLDRLFHIASTSTYLAQDALNLAIQYAQSGRDVSAYVAACEALASLTGQDARELVDVAWETRTTTQNKVAADRLMRESSGYMGNLIKDSIRMCYSDMAEHFYRTGDLAACVRALSRMREYCTTVSQVMAVLFRSATVAVNRQNWPELGGVLARLASSEMQRPRGHDSEGVGRARLAALQGLYCMCSTPPSYRDAALHFLDAGRLPAEQLSDVLTPNDVAVYGALCALASLDRAELGARLLQNAAFAPILQLEPHLRHAVKFFCKSKFAACFEILQTYRVDYLLDLHLAPHVDALYRLIRVEAVQQYLQPFKSIRIATLWHAVGQDTCASEAGEGQVGEEERAAKKSEFTRVLFQLARDKRIRHRLDLVDGLLVRDEVDERAAAYAEALRTAEEFADQAHLELLHMNMRLAGMQVDDVEVTAAQGRQQRRRRQQEQQEGQPDEQEGQEEQEEQEEVQEQMRVVDHAKATELAQRLLGRW